MNKIKKSIEINAPLEEVFEYFSEPLNLPEIWPSLVQVENLIDDPVERSFDYVYKMAGVKFKGHAETLEFEPNERVMIQSRKGILNVTAYYFNRVEDMTSVTVVMEYEIPGQLLSKVAEPIIRRINEREVTSLLNNLKDRMELAAGLPDDATPGDTPPLAVH